MATAIRARCPDCGEVELAETGLHLWLYDTGHGHRYSFFCPRCYDEVVKPADAHVVALLKRGGVAATVLHVPAEALEAKEGPALTVDDLLEFVLDLRGDVAPPTYESGAPR